MTNFNQTIQQLKDAFGRSGKRAESANVVELRGSAVHSLKAAEQTFKVTSGVAWLSVNGKDVIARCGQAIKLPKGSKERVVISALGADTLAFRVS